jgi:hypothetical protein
MCCFALVVERNLGQRTSTIPASAFSLGRLVSNSLERVVQTNVEPSEANQHVWPTG